MDLSQVPPIIREAVAAHMILQAAGVSPDDLYVDNDAVSPSGEPNHLAVLVVQGDFQFAVTVGRCNMQLDEFKAVWKVCVNAIKTLTAEEARVLRDGTRIRKMAVHMLAAFHSKRLAYERTKESN